MKAGLTKHPQVAITTLKIRAHTSPERLCKNTSIQSLKSLPAPLLLVRIEQAEGFTDAAVLPSSRGRWAVSSSSPCFDPPRLPYPAWMSMTFWAFISQFACSGCKDVVKLFIQNSYKRRRKGEHVELYTYSCVWCFTQSFGCDELVRQLASLLPD